MPDYKEFAKKVKEKYPQYKDVDDLELSKKMVEKYPEYKSQVSFDEGIKKKVETSTSSQTSKNSAGKPSGSLQALTSGLEKSQASSGKAVNLLGQQTGIPVTQQVTPSTAPLKPTKEQIVPLAGSQKESKFMMGGLEGFDPTSKLSTSTGIESPVDIAFQTGRVKPIDIAGIKGGTKSNIEKNQKYYETINLQKELQNKGHKIEVTGIEDEKTKLASNLERDSLRLIEKEAFGEADFFKSVDNLLTKDKSFYSEEKLVPYLQDKFGKQGFEFEETGIGNQVTVSYVPDGQTETRNMTVDISEEGLANLSDFMKQTRMTQSEIDVVTGKAIKPSDGKYGLDVESSEEYQNKMVELMASNPYKYGKNLIDEEYFTNIVNDRSLDLRVSAKQFKELSADLDKEINDYNNNPTEEGLIALNQKIASAKKIQKDLIEKSNRLDEIQKNYQKATGFYVAEKEKEGTFLGMMVGNLAKGFTGIEKMITSATIDAIPTVLGTDAVVDPVTKSKLDYLGYTDSEIKDYASKQMKRFFMPKLEEGIQNVVSGGGTTKEYSNSADRNELEKTINMLAESVGAAAGGGGNPALTKLSFFAMSKNAIDEEMRGTDFDDLSENQKMLVSVPYALTIGYLENLGFKVSTGIGNNPLLNKITKSILAKTFSSLPKEASIELIEETIKKNTLATITDAGLKIVGGALVEGATEGVQQIDEVAIKNIANAITEKDYFKDVPDLTTTEGIKKTLGLALQDAKYGFYGGLIMAGGSTALNAVNNKFDEKKSNDEFAIFMDNMLDDKLLNVTFDNINTQFEKGEITREQAESQLKALDLAKQTIQSIPENLSLTDKRRSFDLINEKTKIEKSIEGKDKNLVQKETERINQINERLKAIGNEVTSEAEVSAENVTQTDVTDTNVGDTTAPTEPIVEVVKPKIETVEGAETSYTDKEGKFYSEKEVVEMPQEQLSQMTLQNPSETVLNTVEMVFPTQQEVVKEQIEPVKEQTIPTENVAETQATEVVNGETDVVKEGKVNYRVDDVNADNYGDVVFNNPNYVVRGGAGNKATEGYYSWDRSEAKQYADGNEDNLFEGEFKPDSKILELETNDPENYQENADAISEFEKITGMTYDSESFSNITDKEIKLLKKAGYDAVRGATIDGLATVVVNKDSITPLNQQQPTSSVEQIDTQQKSVEKTTENVQTEEKPLAEKPIETKFKKVADNIRKLKTTPPKFINPETGEEFEFTKQGFDWNDLVESIAVAVEKTGDVVGSVKEYLGKQDWYNKLSDDGKKAFENQVVENLPKEEVVSEQEKVSAEKPKESAKPKSEEKESPKEKVSKQAERAADMQDNETGKRLREISRYEVQNQEEHLNIAKEIVKLAGGEREAIQYVNDPKNRVNAEVKEAAMMVASGEIVAKAEIMKAKALEKGDAEMLVQAESDIEEGLMYVRDVSLEGTKMGQRNAFKKKIYEAYPMMYNLSNKDKFTKKWGATTEQQEDINELQQNIQKEVDRIIDEEFSNGETIDKLKEEIEKLKSELEKEKSKKSSKSEAKAEKIKDIQKKRKDLFAELKKERRGGNVSASIFGLTSRQIELIGDIVKTYTQEGYTRADKIVSDIYFNLKDDVEGIRKEHIRTIAREIEEFESLHKQEVDKNQTSRVDKLKEKLAKLQKGNEDISLEVKDSDTDEIKDLKKQIKDEQVLSPKVLKDLMKQHFAGKNPNYRTFAEAIAQKTGKTTAEVQDLADVIEERIKMKVEDMVKREHKKFVEQSKKVAENPTIKALKEKRSKGIATKEELELLDKKLEDSKSRTEVNQIMKLLSMGGLLNSSDFARAFEKRFGFKQLSSTTQKQVDALANEIFELTRQAELEVTTSNGTKKGLSATQKMRIGMLQKKLNTILEANKPFTTARVIKEIVSAIYVNMLSGILTFARAGIGGYGSGFLGTGAYLVNNLINPLKWGTNIPALGKGLTAMIESLPSAYIRATQARKTGYDVFKDSALKGERSTENTGWYEKTLLSGLNEAYNNKEWGKVVVKSFGQALKVIHALGSLDAFMNTMTGSFVGTTEASKKGEFDKLMNGDLYDIATNEWNDFKKSIEELVNIQNPNFSVEEKSSAVDRIIRQELGIAGSRFQAKKVFVKNRVQELREVNLGEFFEQGVSLSKDASMMGQPDGMGGLIAQGLGNISNIKDDDKALVAILKLIPNLIFKFGRITGQAINKSFNNIPILGIANAYFGVGYNPKTGELEYGDLNQRYKSNPLLFKQRLASNLLVTATTLVAFASMFDDDDEEGLTLDPNRKFDLRGFGNTSQGGKAKNERLYEGYRNLSISFTKDKDGNFTNYIELKLLPDLAGIAATIGYYADILKGDVKFSKDEAVQKAKLDEFRKNAYSISTIFKALSQNTKLVTESSFSSIAGLKRNYEQGDDLLTGLGYVARGIAMDNVKPLVEPRVIESIITTASSVSGLKEKELKDWQYFAKNLYGADAFFEDNKTDVFGNEYVKENDYEKFLKETFGAGEKRSDKFKEVELLYKFNQGANISKRQFNEMKPDSKSGFIVSGSSPFGRYSSTYISMDDKIPAEAQKIQETYFRQLVLENYDMLNSVETKEELEEELKALQEESTQYAKEEIVSKYEGTKKIIELTE